MLMRRKVFRGCNILTWIIAKRMIDDPDSSREEPNVTIDEDREKAALENVRCLLTFLDEYIKPKQEFIKSTSYHSIAFSDLWYLFSPGDTVVTSDGEQSYRVIEVSFMRHRVRKPNKKTLAYWKNDSTAEPEESPILIHCVHVDFNGSLIGPVNQLFTIQPFPDMKAVRQLQIFPLRFAEDSNLGERLVERGKLFMEVARVKHMHYSGLTLETHDEVDSQVVVDFEEAIARNERWSPEIKSAFNFSMPEKREKRGRPLKVIPGPFPRRKASSSSYYSSSSDSDDEVRGWCVPECCESEITHNDEYVEARLRDEHIRSGMNNPKFTRPMLALVSRTLKEMSEDEFIGDDDYMIMSSQVLGFVLRNRKWGMYLTQRDYLDITALTIP